MNYTLLYISKPVQYERSSYHLNTIYNKELGNLSTGMNWKAKWHLVHTPINGNIIKV